MSLLKDDYGVRDWVLIVGVVVLVAAIIGGAAWLTAKTDHAHRERLIECVERGNDIEWCLEVIG